MRIELQERTRDITEEERKRLEDMNIEPKGKGFKWRKIWLFPENIFALKEVNDKESIIEFNDGSTIVVKGSYDDIKKIIQEAEEVTEEDLEL